MQQDENLQSQQQEIERYVGRVTTKFSKLEYLMTWVLEVIISDDQAIGIILLKEGFPNFSKKFTLLKKVYPLKYPDSRFFTKAVQRIGESNKIRTEAAHSQIGTVNPGSIDEHMALHDKKQPFSIPLDPRAQEKRVSKLVEAINLVYSMLEECLGSPK